MWVGEGVESEAPMPRFHGERGRTELAIHGAGCSETATLAWVRAGHPENQPERLLHPLERTYYHDIPAERRRRSYLLGRHAGKYALGAENHPCQVSIQAGALGHPVVSGPDCNAREISISHHDDLACAVAAPPITPITLDIEAVDPRHTEVILTKMNQRERALWESGLDETAHEGVTLLWTAKEALSKFLRCGLGCDLKVLEVADLHDAGNCFEGRFRSFPQYRFVSWVPAPGFVVSLVLPTALTLSFTHQFSESNDAKEDITDVGSAFSHSANP